MTKCGEGSREGKGWIPCRTDKMASLHCFQVGALTWAPSYYVPKEMLEMGLVFGVDDVRVRHLHT